MIARCNLAGQLLMSGKSMRDVKVNLNQKDVRYTSPELSKRVETARGIGEPEKEPKKEPQSEPEKAAQPEPKKGPEAKKQPEPEKEPEPVAQPEPITGEQIAQGEMYEKPWEQDFYKFIKEMQGNKESRYEGLDKEAAKEKRKRDNKIYRNRRKIQNLINFKKELIADNKRILEIKKRNTGEAIRQQEQAIEGIREEIEMLQAEIVREEEIVDSGHKDGNKLRRTQKRRV